MSARGRGERVIEHTLTLVALSSIAILFIITFFIFKEGLPFIIEEGVGKAGVKLIGLVGSLQVPEQGKVAPRRFGRAQMLDLLEQ